MSVKPRAQFTLEFKLEAVRLVKAGQSDRRHSQSIPRA